MEWLCNDGGQREEELTEAAIEAPEEDWQEWLGRYFPHVVTHGFSERHVRLWEWFEALTPGVSPRPRFEGWPRGGAKSSTAELGCVRVGHKKTRSFALYVSRTQDLADLHVQAISTLFETIGIPRLLSKYGHSKGWRRNQLRTANGFNVAAIGLDVAGRGVKLDQYRPDLIILDDVDEQDDTPRTIQKKIGAITGKLLPAGSSDCAVLFIQNLIHEDSIATQIVENRAEFLLDREPPFVEPAVVGLQVESVDRGDGRKTYRITGGTPTWDGQSLRICEEQINRFGLRSFLREAQHEVAQADGYFFDHRRFEVVDRLPPLVRLVLAGDLAATEGGGDYTALVLMGIDAAGVVYVISVWRGQWGSDKVRETLLSTAQHVKEQHGCKRIRLPQDPGQAGKFQKDQLRELLKGFDLEILPVTGKKPVRARGYAEHVNAGNVRLLEGEWNHAFKEEHRKFREDESHEFDDQVDAAADAYNDLRAPVTIWRVR